MDEASSRRNLSPSVVLMFILCRLQMSTYRMELQLLQIQLLPTIINCSWPGRWQCPTIRTTILDLGASPLPTLSLVTLCGVAIQRCFFLGGPRFLLGRRWRWRWRSSVSSTLTLGEHVRDHKRNLAKSRRGHWHTPQLCASDGSRQQNSPDAALQWSHPRRGS